jgi:hypothetical protein
MQAVTGVFPSQKQAEVAVRRLKAHVVPADRITLLTPGKNVPEEMSSVSVDTTEQPGMGTAIGAVVGGATGISGGLMVAAIPGVGPVIAVGMLGAAILGAAGATVGGIVGGSLENVGSKGLPEDEIFVYEDALRRGRSVVVTLADDQHTVDRVRELLEETGAETVDAAREQWWIGLRSAEREHYAKSGRDFHQDEKFYRRGFEAALHAKTRCKEFDQVSAEMDSKLEDLQRQNPGVDVAEPFTRGYQRGREYYQRICDQSKAA